MTEREYHIRLAADSLRRAIASLRVARDEPFAPNLGPNPSDYGIERAISDITSAINEIS